MASRFGNEQTPEVLLGRIPVNLLDKETAELYVQISSLWRRNLATERDALATLVTVLNEHMNTSPRRPLTVADFVGASVYPAEGFAEDYEK